MQRIDENTYIDDTLVTCAEYQLFIDEMHEQGKYYQPDHWTSYQFPEGKAREPILGVRQSDAIAFCEWLIQRDDKWVFRLPTKEEVSCFPLKDVEETILGCWANMQFQFVYEGTPPKNARRIAHALALELINEQALAHARARAGASFFSVNDIRALERARDRAVDIAFELDVDHTLIRVLELERAIDQVLDFAIYFSRDLTHTLDVVVEHVRDITLDRALDFTLSVYHNFTFDKVRDIALDIYVDLFTLQERIAGRSPAFEGIRLVKYR